MKNNLISKKSIQSERSNAAGIYIHIPFCQQKCFYCGFYSRSCPKIQEILEYETAVLREMEIYRDQDICVRTIYFGGGTPSFVPISVVEKIMHKLSEVFELDLADDSIEKTIEVNPASAIREKMLAYHQMGFNRLSVGLQTVQNDLLKRIGRIHTLEEFDQTMNIAGEVGFKNISADVLFGLPGQSVLDVRSTIDHLLGFDVVKHISCYSLKVEPGTVFDRLDSDGQLVLPDEDTEREMYYQIVSRLKAAGFKHYEISNFAKSGYESVHNSAYWDLTPYIGFGPAAASFYGKRRYTNTGDLEAYCSDWKHHPPRSEEYAMDTQTLQGDFMFLGLRRLMGVRDADYQKLFGSSFFLDYKNEIDRLEQQKLIDRTTEGIALTDLGLDFANRVFEAFV